MSSTARARVCVLTPEGRAAIAVVEVAGPDAVALVSQKFHAASGVSLADQPLNRIAFGRWEAERGEEVIVVRTKRGVEVNCHGGRAAAAAVCRSLVECGAKPIDQSAWLAAQPLTEMEREAHLALAQSTTRTTALILLDQLSGALERSLCSIDELLKTKQSTEAQTAIESLLATWQYGQFLTRPAHVVLTGPPNVGKSSLINAMLGYERAIVFDTPGTTRDVVSARTAIDGWPIELSDTAGLRAEAEGLEQSGIELAQQTIERADLVVVVDEAQNWIAGNPLPLEFRRATSSERLLKVANKIDQLDAAQLHTVRKRADIVPTCATDPSNRAGIEPLLKSIGGMLIPETPPTGAAVLFSVRQRDVLARVLESIRAGDIATAQRLASELLY